MCEEDLSLFFIRSKGFEMKSVKYVVNFLLLFGLLSVGGGGCAILEMPMVDQGSSGNKKIGIGICKTNSDCLNGQICYQRYCKTLPTGDEALVSLQLIPPPNHRFRDPAMAIVKQQILGIPLSSINDKAIILRKALTISGKVVTSRAKTPVAAKVRFINSEYIPGQKLIWEAITDPRPSMVGHFSQRLTYGNYWVEVWPKDSAYPPFRKRVKIDTNRVQNLEIPDLSDYLVLRGRILYQQSKRPLGAVKIQVFNSEGVAISQIVETDERGVFSVRISYGEKPSWLKVFPRTIPPLIPELVIPYRFLVKMQGKIRPSSNPNARKGQPLNLPVIPEIYPVRVSGEVRSRARDGGQLIANCKLRFKGKIEMGGVSSPMLKGNYITYVQTDSNGRYEAMLLPGRYQIEVFPPPGSDRAKAIIVLKEPILNEQKINIELLSKRKVLGKVCLREGDKKCRLVGGVQVKAIWRKSLASHLVEVDGSLISISLSRSVISSQDGWFEFFLDPGYYDFIFIPPDNIGAARTVRSMVRVESKGEESPQIIEETVLQPAHYYIGQILGPDRKPVPNLTVELYRYEERPEHPAILLGRAITNTAGYFSIPYHLEN